MAKPALVTVAIVASLALAGCASPKTEVSAAVSHQPSVVASPESTPSATPTASTRFAVVIEKYQAMSVAEFSALPKSEQLIFAYALLQRDLPNFIQKWQSISHNPRDVMPPAASLDNTIDQVIANIGWQNRFAFSLADNDRTKYMQAIYHDGDQSPLYRNAKTVTDHYPGATHGNTLAYLKALPWGTATSTTGISDANGEKVQNVKYQNISYRNADGTSETVTAYFEPITVNGVPVAMWILH